jgi:hypothetical protein
MENDSRYFWRRAVEEFSAARRSVTFAAQERHQHLVRLYLERLAQLGAPMPYSLPQIEREFGGSAEPERPAEAA